ncbi:MAG: hypothetical protein CEE38_17275 [Planctomycetes bacterium B3_Pla]|nr:MAG: hypothetical protein CEE38_17275 [Planctomycetes bacterium B3_Pla]
MEFSDFPTDGKWKYEKGVLTTNLSCWADFYSTIKELRAFPDYKKLVWRGQRRDDPLLSTFDRDLKKKSPENDEDKRERLLDEHLKNFKSVRRKVFGNGINEGTCDDDLWAIGQHYGMLTPLLDWTHCPFIAAYFAFHKKGEEDHTKYRVVYGLHRGVRRLLRIMKKGKMRIGRDHLVEFPSPSPVVDHRLRAQKGLFTRALNGVDIKTNVVRRFEAKRPGRVFLIEINIPDVERKKCLKPGFPK